MAEAKVLQAGDPVTVKEHGVGTVFGFGEGGPLNDRTTVVHIKFTNGDVRHFPRNKVKALSKTEPTQKTSSAKKTTASKSTK